MAATSEALDPNSANIGNGALAQLGERLHGMQEVSGSIPLGSTKIFLGLSIANRGRRGRAVGVQLSRFPPD